MPAYSFHKYFAPAVEAGEKLHTIRGRRKARPKPGQRFVGYQGMRTKHCRKLCESVITRVDEILLTLNEHAIFEVYVNGVKLAPDELEVLARNDGFKAGARQMATFWKGHYPFEGDLIHWAPPQKSTPQPTELHP